MYAIERGPLLVLPNGVVGPHSWETMFASPPTEKRIKPSDLFASATDRTVFSSTLTNAVYPAYVYGDQVSYDFLYSGREYYADFSGAIKRVHGKLLDKIKRQNVNLAQFMAEYRQAATLFETLAGQLYQGYKALRRRHFIEVYRDLSRDRGFSKKWIEYQFGLLPLVSDLEGVCLSLADKLRNGATFYATVSVHDSDTYHRRYYDSSGNGYLYHDESELFSIRLKARWEIQDQDLDDIRRFGFYNVPALAWELVPFSFVVDWAIPVGDWLNRLDALVGINNLVYNVGYRNRWSSVTSSERGPAATSSTVTKGRALSQVNLTNFFPSYEPSKSLKKIVTGLALLRLISKGT